MVKTALVETLKEAGNRLIQTLDVSDLEITAALWFYETETDSWRLLLATPLVATEGSRAAYERILQVLSSHPEIELHLTDITVLPPSDPLLQLLRTAIRTGHTIAGITFSRTVINGTYIEDAYIYRIT